MEESLTCVHSEGFSGKEKLRMTRLCRFCSCLLGYHRLVFEEWHTGCVLLRSFYLKIQVGHWRDPMPSCALASWGPPDAMASSPDGVLLLPWYVQLALCLQADGIPFREALPALHTCSEDVGLGKYTGPRKEQVPNYCGRSMSAKREMGDPCNVHG